MSTVQISSRYDTIASTERCRERLRGVHALAFEFGMTLAAWGSRQVSRAGIDRETARRRREVVAAIAEREIEWLRAGTPLIHR